MQNMQLNTIKEKTSSDILSPKKNKNVNISKDIIEEEKYPQKSVQNNQIFAGNQSACICVMRNIRYRFRYADTVLHSRMDRIYSPHPSRDYCLRHSENIRLSQKQNIPRKIPIISPDAETDFVCDIFCIDEKNFFRRVYILAFFLLLYIRQWSVCDKECDKSRIFL